MPKRPCRFPTRGQAGSLSLIIAALLTFALKVQGQASLSDSTFAIEPGTVGLVSAILGQGDGKILVGGSFTQIAGQTHPYLARLESNGQLDTSFPAETDGSVFRLLAQPDGKILVGGSFNNLQGVARKGIGRLLTNGTVDLDFDAGLLPGSEQSAFALGLQPAGKILYVNLAPNGELFRLNSDGQLDSSFVQTNVFQGFHAFASRCKNLSVNCLSSIRLAHFGVRRSEGERSEPSAAEPRSGRDAPRVKNWSRAGHGGFLLGCHKHIQLKSKHDPPHRS